MQILTRREALQGKRVRSTERSQEDESFHEGVEVQLGSDFARFDCCFTSNNVNDVLHEEETKKDKEREDDCEKVMEQNMARISPVVEHPPVHDEIYWDDTEAGDTKECRVSHVDRSLPLELVETCLVAPVNSPQDLARALLPPPPMGQNAPPCADTTIMLPTYRESEELIHGVGGYLLIEDEELKTALELMIIVDGHPAPPQPDNDTLRSLRVILGIGPNDPGIFFPGHFRVWKGYMSGIPYALYVKLPEMARGKRNSQVLCFDLSAFRERTLGVTSKLLINQDADTRAPESSVRHMRELLLRRTDVFGVSPILECINNKWYNPFTMLGHALELRACFVRHSFSLFARTDVLAGPFSAFNWHYAKRLVDDFAKPIEASSLFELQWHLGEDGRFAQLACAKGFKVMQSQIEGYWVLPDNIVDLMQQRRRWNCATLCGLLWVSFGIPKVMWNPKNPCVVLYSLYYLFQATIPTFLGLGVVLGGVWGFFSHGFQEDNDERSLFLLDMTMYGIIAFTAFFYFYSSGKSPKSMKWVLLILYTLTSLAGLVVTGWMGRYLVQNIPLSIALGLLFFGPLLIISHPTRWPNNIWSTVVAISQVITYPVIIGTYSIANMDMHSWGMRESDSDADQYGGLAAAESSDTDVAVKIERMFGGHQIIYNRNHYGYTPEQFRSRLQVLRCKKWAMVVFHIVCNFALTFACRYYETGYLTTIAGQAVDELWAILTLFLFIFFGFLTLVIGLAHIMIYGPARTPLGRPPLDRSMYPPTIPADRLPYDMAYNPGSFADLGLFSKITYEDEETKMKDKLAANDTDDTASSSSAASDKSRNDDSGDSLSSSRVTSIETEEKQWV